MNIKELWNSQADHQNQWDSLGEDEKLAFAMGLEAAKWDAQTNVEIHEAVLEEREECAKVCESHVRYPSRLHFAEAIRARSKA
jgi:hypothetical protein